MTRRLVLALLLWAGLALAPAPAAAQEASPELRARAEQVVALLRGEAAAAEMFAPSFLAAVPEAQLATVTRQLVAQHGEARALAGILPRSATAAAIQVDMERAVLSMNLSIEAAPPHRIEGLLVTGAAARAATFDELVAELRALPGQVSFAVARLGDGAPEPIAALEPDRPLAIGSAFKLLILAELDRQIAAGDRRWSDVATLDRRSLPSGQLQGWPDGAPLTLHTLAAMMISVSDNTATDVLLHLVGREQVEATMARIGVAAAARNRPFPGTLEMFALKTAPEAEQEAWIAADEADRRRLLAERYDATAPDGIDPARFAGAPLRIEALEWFASADDMVRILDWLRRRGGDEARAILAISPGGAPALREEFAYVGYKGGSEPGVINLSWLVRAESGDWYAVTGSWNDPAAPLDEARFAALMRRALQLLRRQASPTGEGQPQ